LTDQRVNCPHCDFEAARMKLHRHLVEAHLDRVTTEHDAATGKMRYVVACPVCGLKYQHAVKPRYKDPRFLDEFKAEIALVAFDQLLYHLEEQHPREAAPGD
jgi:transcription elongation factor Elf1